MSIHKLEDDIGLAGALTPDELEEARQQGYRALICNRRPQESEDHDEGALAERAQALGLQWCCIPVATGEYSEADIAAFHRALEELPRPLLMFCRSGRRSVHLWALARIRHDQMDPEAVLARVRVAGHDPDDLRSMAGQDSTVQKPE